MMKYIPNILSFFRLALIVPFIALLKDGQYNYAFFVYMLAGLTDGLDGWLARTFDCKTALGSFIDPVADKLLVMVSFFSLAFLHQLPWWLVWLVFARDFCISAAIIYWCYYIQKSIDFKASMLSKVNTTFQLFLVTVSLFQLAWFNIPPQLIIALICITAFTTAASFIDYLWTWGRLLWIAKTNPK